MIHLVVMLKGRTIGRFDLEGDGVRLGRHPDNEVQIDSMSVSRFHCALTRDPQSGAWWAEDAGSHNGTYVNGARVEARRELRDGDTLGIGQFLVSVRTDAEPGPSASQQISVRATRDPEQRERAAPEKGFLVLENRPGPPLPLVCDVTQVGAAPEADVQLAGPAKSALFVRGYGGFQVVNVRPGEVALRVNGREVLDRAWLADGATVEVGPLRVTFHAGMPADEDQSTMVINLPRDLLPPGWQG